MDSCVRGYHYYQNTWNPFIGKVLSCVREDGNPHDKYAVAQVALLVACLRGFLPCVTCF